jgi:hypothetical protein
VGVEPECSWTMFAPSYRKDVVNPPIDFVARRPTGSYWKLAVAPPLSDTR